MRNILYLLLPIILLVACNSQKDDPRNSSNNSVTIAPLLDRNEKIQYGNEWDQVQNNFGTLRNRINLNQQDADAKINLALLFAQEARVTGEHGHYFPASLDLLNSALTQDEVITDDLRFLALSSKAGVQLSLHHFTDALQTGKEAVSLNAYNAQIYGVLADAYVELGNYEGAVTMADKMVSIRPDLRSYARVSYLREIYGDLKGAIDAMQLAVSAGFPPYEETAWARYQLARLYEADGDYAEAENQYNQILVHRPDYPFALAALAEREKSRGNIDKAINLLDEAITAIPEVSFYVDKATIYLSKGDKEAGQAIMQDVLAMLQDDEKSGHNMDLYYSEIYSEIFNDQEKALQYAMKEYTVRPLNIEVNKQLALIYSRMQDFESAREHLEKALKTNSKDHVLIELQRSLSVES